MGGARSWGWPESLHATYHKSFYYEHIQGHPAVAMHRWLVAVPGQPGLLLWGLPPLWCQNLWSRGHAVWCWPPRPAPQHLKQPVGGANTLTQLVLKPLYTQATHAAPLTRARTKRVATTWVSMHTTCTSGTSSRRATLPRTSAQEAAVRQQCGLPAPQLLQNQLI